MINHKLKKNNSVVIGTMVPRRLRLPGHYKFNWPLASGKRETLVARHYERKLKLVIGTQLVMGSDGENRSQVIIQECCR